MNTTENKIINIVIIDDFEPVRGSLSEYLSLQGYNVLSVANAEDALSIQAENNIDLFIIDINLPGMSGIDFLREIEIDNNTYSAIIITSVDHDMKLINDAMALGASSFIYKPVDFENLSQHIDRALIRTSLKKESGYSSRNNNRKENHIEVSSLLQSLQNAHERFDSLLNCLEEAIVAVDPSHCIMVMNKKFGEVISKNPEECLYSTLDNVISDSSLLDQLHLILNKRNSALEYLTVNTSILGQGIAQFYYTFHVSALSDTQGNHIGKILSLSNQTDRIKTEKMRQTILNNLVHELRTPLTSIVSMTEALKATSLNNEQLSFVDIIKKCEALLMKQLNKNLDFSRLDRNIYQLAENQFMISELCNDCIKIMTPHVEKKGLNISYFSCGDSDFPVFGDKEKLMEILINLINNALKFTHKGSIEVNSQCKIKDEKSITVKFDVIDTGIGIKEADKSIIFKEFIQLDDKANRKYDGMGLGLAITKKLVELMNGSIAVFDNPEGGSIFTFNVCLKR